METESGFETRENFDIEMHKYPKKNSPMIVANHNPHITVREISTQLTDNHLIMLTIFKLLHKEEVDAVLYTGLSLHTICSTMFACTNIIL